eukprot:CAMPEP_0173301602 /NCGR_PEP_ID=MMETSP1143-20121109/17882_1 /TAXON_ID=483371 /ORGANISM="non described non described, Strain CCMP2298" /LENGTH=182 /DNA_ID=CAMNT_0014242133 /DNA_START=241 /DNA_END=789 /DNA_ORIENTATION=+
MMCKVLRWDGSISESGVSRCVHNLRLCCGRMLVVLGLFLCAMASGLAFPSPAQKTGIIIVDHGSRKETANLSLLQLVDKFKLSSGHQLVEAAHMELAEPSIATAYQRCVEQGASHIVCHPYFLSRGRHVQEDIPALMLQAAAAHPGTQYSITEPLGLQEEQIVALMKTTIDKSLGLETLGKM